jgi:hypothetical protein
MAYKKQSRVISPRQRIRKYVNFYIGQNVNGKNQIKKIKQIFEEEEKKKYKQR